MGRTMGRGGGWHGKSRPCRHGHTGTRSATRQCGRIWQPEQFWRRLVADECHHTEQTADYGVTRIPGRARCAQVATEVSRCAVGHRGYGRRVCARRRLRPAHSVLLTSHSGRLTRLCIARPTLLAISGAMRPWVPCSSTAMSPARPCTYTASTTPQSGA